MSDANTNIPEDNFWLPEEERVCETCGQTGKDENGNYSGFFDYKTQHPIHVDWDAVRKTLDSMMED